MKKINKVEIKEGLIAALPIIVGYLPIGIAFGLLSKTAGISLLESFMFSALVYAGSSQFMALNLLLVGTGLGGIIITTFLVNFRYFLMTASLAEKMEDIDQQKKGWLALMAFWVSDEIFSVASFRKKAITKEYLLSLEALAYLSWPGGTVLGYIIGNFLPEPIQASMGIGIYAMFIALLLPEAKKSKIVAILAILSGLTNTLLIQMNFLPQGWSIVVSVLLISTLGLILNEKGVISIE